MIPNYRCCDKRGAEFYAARQIAEGHAKTPPSCPYFTIKIAVFSMSKVTEVDNLNNNL